MNLFFLRASEDRSSRLRRLTLASLGLVVALIPLAVSSVASAAGPSHSKHKSAKSSSGKRKTAKKPAGKMVHSALVKVSTARLRSEPGKNSKAIALLDEGRSAKVVARKDGWAKIRVDSGRTGWVRSDLLSVAKRAEHDKVAATPSRKARRAKTEDAPPRRKTVVASAKPKTPKSKSPKPAAKNWVAKAAPKPTVKRVMPKPHQVAVTLRKAMPSPTPAPVKIAIAAEAPTVVESADLARTPDPSPSASPTPAPVDRSTSRGERMVRTALGYRGTPYRMGATGRGAFDCSGFMMYLFSKEGTPLPRTAAEQYRKGEVVAKENLRAGDLVFFKNTYKHGVSHVGMYVGNGDFVHASSNGRGVRTDNLSKSFYINHWAGARRPR